jgi:hypothetical protein
MHPTIYFQKKPDILISVASFFRKCSVGLTSTPLGPPSLVKYPVLYIGSQFFQLLGSAYCSRYSLVSYYTGCYSFPKHYFFVLSKLYLFFYFLLSLPYRIWEKPTEFSPLNCTGFSFCKRIQNKLSQGVWYNHGWQLDSNETGVRLKFNFCEFSRNNDYNTDLDLNKIQDLSTTYPIYYKYRPNRNLINP